MPSRSAVGNSFPVAGASRRRRLLLNQAYQGTGEQSAGTAAEAAGGKGERVRTVRLPSQDAIPTFGTIRRLLDRPEPLTWVFTGDCLTGGVPPAERERNFGEHFADRVRMELGRLQDVVIQTAVPGERVSHLLERLHWQAIRFQPDVISLLLGPGDAAHEGPGLGEFQRSLDEIVRHVRDDGAILVLHTPCRIPEGLRRPFEYLRGYVKVIRDLAREHQIPCVDHWAHWKESHSGDESLRSWLTPDGLHPNAQGHREMAKLLFRKLGIFDERSATCAARGADF